MSPRTEAGRALLLSFAGPWNDVPRDIIESLLPRIEAEAVRDALATLRVEFELRLLLSNGDGQRAFDESVAAVEGGTRA